MDMLRPFSATDLRFGVPPILLSQSEGFIFDSPPSDGSAPTSSSPSSASSASAPETGRLDMLNWVCEKRGGGEGH